MLCNAKWKAAASLHDSTCTAAHTHIVAVRCVKAWDLTLQCRILLLCQRAPLQGCHRDLSHIPALPRLLLHLLHHGGLDQQAPVWQAAGLQLRVAEVPAAPLPPTRPGVLHRPFRSPPVQPFRQCFRFSIKFLPSPGKPHCDRMLSGD